MSGFKILRLLLFMFSVSNFGIVLKAPSPNLLTSLDDMYRYFIAFNLQGNNDENDNEIMMKMIMHS